MTMAVVAVLALVAILVIAWLVERQSFDLLSIFAIRWWALIAGFFLVPIPYTDVRFATWATVASSVFVLFLGYATARWGAPRRSVDGDVLSVRPMFSEVSSAYYWRTVSILFGAGLALFLLYVVQVAARFGLSDLVTSPHRVRIWIRDGATPVGFHYFYFLELVPPLVVLGALRIPRHWRPSSSHLWILAGTSLVALLGTTARTNITKSVVWALVIAIFSAEGLRQRRRFAVYAMGAFLAIIALFTMYGDFLGKSYENSRIATQTNVEFSEQLQPLALPAHYIAGPLPTLDRLLHDDGVTRTWGALTFHPVAQIYARFDTQYEEPSHIGEFYDIPIPFNVATQLDVMFKDFGHVGILFFSWLLGAAAGIVAEWRTRDPRSMSAALVHSWMALILFASSSGAAYIKMSYWFQFAILWIVGRHGDRLRRDGAKVGGSQAISSIGVPARASRPTI